jgi:hypothetical protein
MGYYLTAAKPTMTTAVMYGILAGAVAGGIGFFIGRKG